MKLLARLLACLQMPLMPPSAAAGPKPARPCWACLEDLPDSLLGDAAGTEPGDGPTGCGWFDSSHDLQRGLVVQEHLSPDSLAQELPLDAWLALHLSGWQPPGLRRP
jgi:hypothetical protein